LICLAVLAFASACGAASPPPPRTLAPAGNDVTSADDERFLVHLDSGAIVLRSATDPEPSVLVQHADAVLYDAALDLLWFRAGDRLKVLDVRAPTPAAVEVARGLPVGDRFVVHRGEHAVQTEDGCDLPFVGIEWNARTTIESVLEDAPGLRIENQTWFVSQLGRPAQPDVPRRVFGPPAIALPSGRLDCEDASACATTVPFGRLGYELVLTIEKMGGDCWQRECLLRDQQTGKFATPPRATTWGDASVARTGPCGLYLFDRAQTAYLIDHELCTPAVGCKSLGGRALGWLVPGDQVGMPGLGNFD
jgi:hypothetical protein